MKVLEGRLDVAWKDLTLSRVEFTNIKTAIGSTYGFDNFNAVAANQPNYRGVA